MRRTVLLVAAALLIAAPAFAGLSMGSSTDVTTLVKRALVKLHAKAQFKKALLLEADGTTKSGKTTTAAGIKKWRLVFQNQTTKGSKYASAVVRVTNGKLGKIVGVKEPFVEDRNIKPVPKMTLATAVAKVRKAGLKDGFGAVTLRYPLGPGFHEPLYIFSFGSGEYWSVGTKTGKVKPLS
jgi:hypothetical protein